jgi:hypothetical protein
MIHPRLSPGDFLSSRGSFRDHSCEHPAFASPDDADHRIIDGRGYAERFAQARDCAIDGVHLASASGVIVQQHRGPRIRNFAAEFSDVLDRIADVQPDIGSIGYGDGFLGAAPRYAPGIGVDEDFADRQPGAGPGCPTMLLEVDPRSALAVSVRVGHTGRSAAR